MTKKFKDASLGRPSASLAPLFNQSSLKSPDRYSFSCQNHKSCNKQPRILTLVKVFFAAAQAQKVCLHFSTRHVKSDDKWCCAAFHDTYRLFWHDYHLHVPQAERKAVDPSEALYLTSKTRGKTESDPRVDPSYQRPVNPNDRRFSRYFPLHWAGRRDTDFVGSDHGLGMHCWPLECVGTTWKYAKKQLEKQYKILEMFRFEMFVH